MTVLHALPPPVQTLIGVLVVCWAAALVSSLVRVLVGR
jgi:hypothetical protein